jgi:hypothetical protein
MDWIDKEIDLIKSENDAKRDDAERREIINKQSPAAWSEFRGLIEEAVRKLNASPEARKKIGEITFNGSNVQTLRIENLAFPSVFITITSTHTGVKVERKRSKNPDSYPESYIENLDHDLIKGHVSFRNEQGEPLSIEEAVNYVLIPLVRKHDDLAFSMPSTVRQ